MSIVNIARCLRVAALGTITLVISGALLLSRPQLARGDGGDSGSGDILIGEYGSMTGSEATFGISTDRGISLAVKQQNEAGGINGRKIKLIAYDDQGKQQEVINSVTRLIQQDHVVALLGEVASSRSIAGGQVAQRMGVPMITPSSTNAKVTTIGDMISRVCFIDSFQGWAVAKFARDNLHCQKVAVLYNRSQAYSFGLKDDFAKALKKMGGTVVLMQAYSDGDTDFSAQLSAIRDAQPDAIYIPGYYTEVVTIAQQARKLGITAALLGSDGWDSEELKNAGTALDGAFYSNHYAHEEQRPEVQDFVKQYQAEYHDLPDGLAATGYDAAKLLFDAMKRAKSLSGRDLAEAINSTKGLKLVTGVVTIDAHRNAKKSIVMLRLEGGTPSYYATILPPD
jgi:branched-chain amino acid transport system substrate-binding protein